MHHVATANTEGCRGRFSERTSPIGPDVILDISNRRLRSIANQLMVPESMSASFIDPTVSLTGPASWIGHNVGSK